MTIIAGMILCGKRGGPTFLETFEVDPETLKCPEGTVLCSDASDATEAVCMERQNLDQCPILDIVVIYKKDISYYQVIGFEIAGNWPIDEGVDEKYSTYLAFSKISARKGVGYGPVMGTTINTREPCYGAEKDQLIIP